MLLYGYKTPLQKGASLNLIYSTFEGPGSYFELKTKNVSFSPNVIKLRTKGCHTYSALFRVFDLILRGSGIKY